MSYDETFWWVSAEYPSYAKIVVIKERGRVWLMR